MNVLPDAQASMAVVLKPPAGFEQLYQGAAASTPIPFVSAAVNGEFKVLDDLAGKPGFDELLQRFVAVPLGAALMILIPRAIYVDGATVREVAYDYQLRWRMRVLSGFALQAEDGNNAHPYHLLNEIGAPTATSDKPLIMPSYVSDEFTPEPPASAERVLAEPGVFATSSQGIYNPADFTGAAEGGNLALGPNYFAPQLTPALGDELSIVAIKGDEGTWNFSDTGATGDAGFSNIFGVNIAGPQHPAYPGLGIYLVVLSQQPAPAVLR